MLARWACDCIGWPRAAVLGADVGHSTPQPPPGPPAGPPAPPRALLPNLASSHTARVQNGKRRIKTKSESFKTSLSGGKKKGRRTALCSFQLLPAGLDRRPRRFLITLCPIHSVVWTGGAGAGGRKRRKWQSNAEHAKSGRVIRNGGTEGLSRLAIQDSEEGLRPRLRRGTYKVGSACEDVVFRDLFLNIINMLLKNCNHLFEIPNE